MESVDLDMGDIFDEGNVEEDFSNVGPLPDLSDNDEPSASQAGNDEDAENSEVLSKLKDLSKGAAKKVVRKPQPKLDSTRLTGDRGIPILPSMYRDVKFKGKGHEGQDLKIIMRYLEHWTHRLFPKMPFDEVLERIEKLGTKKEVQTCIKRMRMDMPILHNDFIGNNSDEEGASNDPDKRTDGLDPDAEDVWDEIMKQGSEQRNSQSSASSHTSHLVTALSSPVSPHTSGNISHSAMTPTTSAFDGLSSPHAGGLTPEQRERIERNKRIAMEKKYGKSVFKVPATPSSPAAHSSRTSVKSPAKSFCNGVYNKEMVENPSQGLTNIPNIPHLYAPMEPVHQQSQSAPNTVNGFHNVENTESRETTLPLCSQDTDSAAMSEVIPLVTSTNIINSKHLSDSELSEIIPVVNNHLVNGDAIPDNQTSQNSCQSSSGMSEVIPVNPGS